MTIGGYILFGIGAFIIAGTAAMISYGAEYRRTGKAVTVALAIILCVALFFGMRWFYQNTESGKRAFKSQESNFNAGIERRVEVYDMEGELIKITKANSTSPMMMTESCLTMKKASDTLFTTRRERSSSMRFRRRMIWEKLYWSALLPCFWEAF